MFKRIKTFEDLARLAEDSSQQKYAQKQADLKSQGPVKAQSIGVTTKRGTLGNTISKAGSALGALDPGKLASKIRGIEKQGVIATGAQALDTLGQTLTDSSVKKLEEFMFKSQLPKGWPKKGSKFNYIPVVNDLKGADKKGIEGVVSTANQSGTNLILNIDFPRAGTPQQTQMPFAKRVVATINTNAKSNPNYAVTGWEVQDIVPGSGGVRDDENSAHVGRPFSYDNITGNFVYDQGFQGKESIDVPPYIDATELQSTYKISPSVGATFDYKMPDGSTIKMKIVSSQFELQKNDGSKVQVVAISPQRP